MKENIKEHLKIHIPIASPPWSGLGKKIESMLRKAALEYNMLEGQDHIAVALSGGKDSLTLLFMLKAISGRGFSPFKITAIHVSGDFSCGASVSEGYLRGICSSLDIELISCPSPIKKEDLECYSCSRSRRQILFNEARKRGIETIAFGHHKDDSNQTLLMNLLHKAEFEGNLPKVPMHMYGITIIRPLIYVQEDQIQEFAKLHGFARITCQCPVGQNSLRKQTKSLIEHIEKVFPNAKENLFQASQTYSQQKALELRSKKDKSLLLD